MKVCRFCALRLAMGEDRPEHDPEYHDADGDADPEDGHVKVKYIITGAGHPWCHVYRPVRQGKGGERQTT